VDHPNRRSSTKCPPTWAWMAVTGVTARDAATVDLRSDFDHYVSAVAASGVFVGLLRAAWRSQPTINVYTVDARIIPIGPHSSRPA
jgi:hypothetical protein